MNCVNPWVIAKKLMLIDTASMDVHTIRRARLRDLIQARYKGIQSKFAERIGRQASYVSRCLYPEGKAGAKNIGEEFARLIERAEKLPPGWLDMPDGEGKKTTQPTIAPQDPFELIEAGLAQLVIVGKRKDEILRDIREAAKDMQLARLEFMREFESKK